MPVRSLNSPVLRWPDRDSVHDAVERWGRHLYRADGRVTRVGYAGSYARGDWGVGSDVDLVVIVKNDAPPFLERARHLDATELPVPADLLVYTEAEWKNMADRNIFNPVVWISDDRRR